MTSMPQPKITVIVPTRDRCDTLVATLRTCLDQNYEHCEIIVSDNLSEDGTKEHVASLHDSRLRYIRTDRRLGMSQNWEFALAHAQGDYVTFVGDDDALLPGALEELAQIIGETRTEAVTWRPASYVWPNSIHAASQNLLFVPCRDIREMRNVPKILREVLAFKRAYDELPVIYKGLVSMDLVREVIRSSGGTFFHSMNPDLYSAIALSLRLEEYCYSYRPYSINGTSVHSNSASQLNPNLGDSAAKAFMREENIPYHADLEFAPSMTLAVAESFMQAREKLSERCGYSIDMKRVLDSTIAEMLTAERSVYEQTHQVVQAIAKKHDLTMYADKLLASARHRPKPPPIALAPGYNFIHKVQIVDCARLGLQNIHQASVLCRAIIDAADQGFIRSPFAVVATSWTIGRGLLARLYRRCKQAMLRSEVTKA